MDTAHSPTVHPEGYRGDGSAADLALLTGVRLRPLAATVLVRAVDPPDTTEAGLVLPEGARQPSGRATVVSVGPGTLLPSGERRPVGVLPGDVVVVPRFGGARIEDQGREYVLLQETELLAVETP